jgi:hypothetical protein
VLNCVPDKSCTLSCEVRYYLHVKSATEVWTLFIRHLLSTEGNLFNKDKFCLHEEINKNENIFKNFDKIHLEEQILRNSIQKVVSSSLTRGTFVIFKQNWPKILNNKQWTFYASFHILFTRRKCKTFTRKKCHILCHTSTHFLHNEKCVIKRVKFTTNEWKK